MAATSSPAATLAAVDVLRAGGNAVDAAVTASAVLCVTEPHMTGIGGDCFALLGLPDGKVVGLNGSGRSALSEKVREITDIPPQSVHAVTVPGAIDAWDRLLGRYGTYSLAQTLEPAIALAEAGVPVQARVAFDWAQEKISSPHYLKDGRAPVAGEAMRYPALARTLRTIAAEGRDAFYEGDIARDIVRTLGGLLAMEDFRRTEATWVEPIGTMFEGREVLELPPNGQGMTVLIALNILRHFGLKELDPFGAARRHLEIEAIKLAWELRNRHVADPDFADIPVEELLGDRMAARLAGLIDPKKALDIRAALPGSDTVYLTVVDRDRLAVSFINSIYWSFGSGIVTEKTGIVLQNRGAGFVTTPGHPNRIAPGKRPLHTIIPAMTRLNGKIDTSFGVMGGNYQPMGHVSVLANQLVYGMDPQEALDWPRCHPENGEVLVEAGVNTLVQDDLQRIGHRLVPATEPLGGGQAIQINHLTGVLSGGSDPRKDGFALGF